MKMKLARSSPVAKLNITIRALEMSYMTHARLGITSEDEGARTAKW